MSTLPPRPDDPIGPTDLRVTSATAVVSTPVLWLLQRYAFNGQIPTPVSLWVCSAVSYAVARGAGQIARWRLLHAAQQAAGTPGLPPVPPPAPQAPTEPPAA